MWSSSSNQWSNSSGYHGNDWGRSKTDWSASSQKWWESRQDSSSDPVVAAPKPSIPSHFKSDDKFYDSTAVGSGNHQFHRTVQSTDWSRKAQIAGRPVDDLRIHELCFRGCSEFSLRLLSEGRFQSIVWTRNSAESVLVTQLLKSLRESKVDIDSVALECIKESRLPVPDKHKQAAAFMQPLVETLMKEIKSHVPQVPSATSADAEELIRAKAKLAQAGLALTPRKGEDSGAGSQSGSPTLKKSTSGSGLPIDLVRGKKRKAGETELEDPEDQVHQLLNGKPVVSLEDNRPASVTTEHVEAWMQEMKQQYKGKFRELNKHVNFVVKLLTEHADKKQLVQAAIRFGLDQKFATRLNVTSLSKCIAVAKYQAA